MTEKNNFKDRSYFWKSRQMKKLVFHHNVNQYKYARISGLKNVYIKYWWYVAVFH